MSLVSSIHIIHIWSSSHSSSFWLFNHQDLKIKLDHLKKSGSSYEHLFSSCLTSAKISQPRYSVLADVAKKGHYSCTIQLKNLLRNVSLICIYRHLHTYIQEVNYFWEMSSQADIDKVSTMMVIIQGHPINI